MSGLLYFTKPAPLSPKSKAQLDEKGYYLIEKGRKKRLKGVLTTESIYYWWFEYLKRSEKYKAACENGGKGMEQLYSDFGDIFAYEGLEGFWAWWKERGQFLFGIKVGNQMKDFVDLDDIKELEEGVARGEFKLVAIPTNFSKTKILVRFKEMLKKLEVQPDEEKRAKYEIKQAKVDVESLENCLLAYDLWKQGLGALDIAIQVRSVSAKEAKDLVVDGRSRERVADIEALIELSEQNYAEYQRRLEIAHERLRKRGLDPSSNANEHILDREMGLLKTNYVRTNRKKSLRTNAYKLIRKAEANIRAVERGEFGIGH